MTTTKNKTETALSATEVKAFEALDLAEAGNAAGSAWNKARWLSETAHTHRATNTSLAAQLKRNKSVIGAYIRAYRHFRKRWGDRGPSTQSECEAFTEACHRRYCFSTDTITGRSASPTVNTRSVSVKISPVDSFKRAAERLCADASASESDAHDIVAAVWGAARDSQAAQTNEAVKRVAGLARMSATLRAASAAPVKCATFNPDALSGCEALRTEAHFAQLMSA